MKKIFLLLPFLFFIQHLSAQLQNINISNGITFDGEPFLAVNPANPQNMVIAWMGLTFPGGVRISIKTKTSFDGGATWGNPNVQQHFGTGFHSADVSMCYRNDGTLFLAYIDYIQNPDSGGIYLSESGDGGITWSLPNQVWNLNEDTVKKPIDRPWLVCDNSATVNNGMLYMSTKPPSWVSAPNRPYLKTSSDSGLTWSGYRFVDTTGFLVGNLIPQPMAAIATSADGALCLAYPSYYAPQSVFPKIYFAKSYDRGAGFQYSELFNNPVFAGDTNLKSGYSLVADPVDPDKLAFIFVGGQNGDADIFVCTTNDGGITWSALVRVNDDAVSNGKHQDLPWASYNAAGDFAVTWRDRRNGSGTGFYQPCETYCAVSHDNGATFNVNFPLSTLSAPFDSVLSNDGNDFMSCKLIDDTIYAAWGDVRSGKLNIYFTKANDSTGVSTGIVQVATEDMLFLNIFPGPAVNSVTIHLSIVDTGGKLEIFDEAGRKVFEKVNPSVSETIDCSKFSTGVYNVVYFGKKYSCEKKMIVIK